MPPSTEGILAGYPTQRPRTLNIAAHSMAAELAREFGCVRLPAIGTSMVPAIHPGDLLCVQRVRLEEISPRDVVVYTRKDRLIVHRVVAVNASRLRESYLVTRGDRLSQDDPKVTSSELLGLVTSLERGDRRLNVQRRQNTTERVMCYVLRYSDRATYVYLRLSAFWRGLCSGGSLCQG